MEVHVEHLGAVQFEIKARQHTIACDQPEAMGGFDEGMTPPELLLASLGSCAAYYAVAYLKKKGIVAPGTRWSGPGRPSLPYSQHSAPPSHDYPIHQYACPGIGKSGSVSR